MTGIIPGYPQPNILICLENILIYVQTMPDLHNSIWSFCELGAEYSIKLHLAQCTLLSTESRWCLRQVSSKGLRYDRHPLQRLVTMDPLTTHANLHNSSVL